MIATNDIDFSGLRDEFFGFVEEIEPGIKARAPGMGQIGVATLIAMSIFQALKESKQESAALRAENDRLRSETVGALTDAGIFMLADGATAAGEIPRAIAHLAADAKRWRKFEGDCGDEHGEIIDHQRRRRAHPPRLTPWTPIDMATVQIVDDIVPVRQIRFRWLDIDGKRRTVREMIDAQLKELADEEADRKVKRNG
jgi:hypothetical protein